MASILLVEDDEVLASSLQLLLSAKEGYSVSILTDGLEASRHLRDVSYDLLVLDCDLPGRSGFDLCEGYRTAGGQAPVLMLTGRSSLGDKEVGFDVGADDYLTKPFETQELILRIKALLRRSGDRRASVRPASTGADLTGRQLSGKYQILSKVGQGGMGIVYQGWDKFLNRLVAVKVLGHPFVDDRTAVSRFQREAQAVSAIKHHNLVTVYDFGMIDDVNPYIVMEFIDGPTLSWKINQGPVALNEALPYFLQICNGMVHAHHAGILHRDLKPSNIMLDRPSGTGELVKIVDFGVAKLMPSSQRELERLTSAGQCFGTAAYMSPENCMGMLVDERSDIYSLGCLMYEALVGNPPYAGDNFLDVIHKHIFAPVPTMAATAGKVPANLEDIILGALEKDPACRPQTMAEMLRSLETVSAWVLAKR